MSKLLIRVLMASLMLPGAMWASADDHSAKQGIEEIMVTATRREESVMEVPQSIQAIQRETLELPIYRNVRDIFNKVPGATAGITQGGKLPVAEGIQLRGSGITQTNAGGGLQPVGYYIDDIPYVDPFGATPPPLGTFDLDSIEVLRGPQGTSWGQDSSAGSVIMRTAPVNMEEFGYRVSAGMMSYSKGSQGYEYSAIVNAPIIEGKLGLRVAIESQEDPGFGEVRGRPEVEDPFNTERDTLRAKLTWLPTDSSEVTFTHTEWATKYRFIPGSNIIDSSRGVMEVVPLSWDLGLEVFPDGIPINNYDIEWNTVMVNVDLGFATLTYAGGNVEATDRDYVDENLAFGVVSLTEMPSDTTTHEIRLVSKDGPIEWLVGFLDMDAESANELAYNFMTYGEFTDYNKTDLEAQAAYGEVTWNVSDQISVMGGIRSQEEDRTENASSAMRAPGDPPGGPYTGYQLGAGSASYSHDNTSYRLGVRWMPSENGIVYLTRSTASRAPVPVTETTRALLAAEGFPNLSDSDASEMVSTELGTKWTLMDGSLDLELVYALGEWEDIPMYSGYGLAGGPLSAAIGGTDADIDAIEVMLDWRVTDSFGITYAGAFTSSEVTGVPDPSKVANFPTAIRVGGDLYNYSPRTHALTVNYAMDFDSGWEGYANATYSMREAPDGFSSVLTPTAYVKAYEDYKVLNLSAGARKDGWDVNVSISNATDFDGQYTPDYSGVNQSIIMFPRAFHLRISHSTF